MERNDKESMEINMVLSLLKGIIKLTGIPALIFAIIILATGIAPIGEYIPLMARISAGLFLLAIVIIAVMLIAKFAPSIHGKIIGCTIAVVGGYFTYLTI